jgi:ribose transport system substrate-binding protein
LAANNTNPFYEPGLEGWNTAAKELGVKVDFVGPLEPNLAEQIKTLEQLVANPSTCGILWYAMDFNAGESLVKEAEAKGITVVIANTDSPFKSRSGFVGTDNAGFGIEAAEYAAKVINCKGQVGSIGNPGAGVSLRMDAFNKHIKELCQDVNVVPSVMFDGSVQAAATLLDAYTSAHPDLTLLWWSEGAAGQMVQPWKEKIQAGLKTLFLATDMPPATLQAVKDGTFIGTLGQNTKVEEYYGLHMLYDKQHGATIPDSIFPRTLTITKANVDKWLLKK